MALPPSVARWQMTSQHKVSDVMSETQTSAESSPDSVHIVLHVPGLVNKPASKHTRGVVIVIVILIGIMQHTNTPLCYL